HVVRAAAAMVAGRGAERHGAHQAQVPRKTLIRVRLHADHSVMSRWGGRAPWRSAAPPALRARVQEIRAARRGVRWSRPLGCVCLGFAAWAALGSDYPLSRSVATASSASAAVQLAPRALAPVGRITTPTPRFTWTPGSWRTFDFVLLDEGLDEVCRVRVEGCALDATDDITRQLLGGGLCYWLVEPAAAGRPARSAPVAIGFSR